MRNHDQSAPKGRAALRPWLHGWLATYIKLSSPALQSPSPPPSKTHIYIPILPYSQQRPHHVFPPRSPPAALALSSRHRRPYQRHCLDNRPPDHRPGVRRVPSHLLQRTPFPTPLLPALLTILHSRPTMPSSSPTSASQHLPPGTYASGHPNRHYRTAAISTTAARASSVRRLKPHPSPPPPRPNPRVKTACSST